MKLMIKRIKGFLFKIWIRRPATVLSVINSRYEVAMVLKAVKEIESINRTDISTVIFKLKEFEKKDKEGKPKVLNNEWGMYQ